MEYKHNRRIISDIRVNLSHDDLSTAERVLSKPYAERTKENLTIGNFALQ